MDDYRWNNYHVPAFGSWGYGNDDDDDDGSSMPYTQCFETARQHHFAYSDQTTDFAVNDDTDLYVTGDLYQNSFVTPAVIVVPRRNPRKGGAYSYSSSNVKGVKKQQQQQRSSSKMQKKQECEWEKRGYSANSYDIKAKQPPSPIILSPPSKHHHYYKPAPKSKPVDEDLYKIPPEFLHVKPKRKKGLGLFSSCLLPACA